MKLSSDTITVLKNFAVINKGIEIKSGNQLKTISPTNTVLAKATISDNFPEDFCIYELASFLSAYALYDNAELDFDAENIIIRSGKSKIYYRKTDKNMIVTTDRELDIGQLYISFDLSDVDFNFTTKSANVLGSPNVVFESDGEKIYITTCDMKNSSSNSNTIEIADGVGKKFKAVILTEYLKMILPGSYTIELSSTLKGLMSFKHTTQDIQYWIAAEQKDSFFKE